MRCSSHRRPLLRSRTWSEAWKSPAHRRGPGTARRPASSPVLIARRASCPLERCRRPDLGRRERSRRCGRSGIPAWCRASRRVQVADARDEAAGRRASALNGPWSGAKDRAEAVHPTTVLDGVEAEVGRSGSWPCGGPRRRAGRSARVRAETASRRPSAGGMDTNSSLKFLGPLPRSLPPGEARSRRGYASAWGPWRSSTAGAGPAHAKVHDEVVARCRAR